MMMLPPAEVLARYTWDKWSFYKRTRSMNSAEKMQDSPIYRLACQCARDHSTKSGRELIDIPPATVVSYDEFLETVPEDAVWYSTETYFVRPIPAMLSDMVQNGLAGDCDTYYNNHPLNSVYTLRYMPNAQGSAMYEVSPKGDCYLWMN